MLQRLICRELRRVPRCLFSTHKQPRNPYLRQIIEEGFPYLEDCTKEMIQNTKESLFAKEDTGPSINQLSEAKRIREVVAEVMDSIADKSGEFCVSGEPIFILDCEVSPCLKKANVLWCLPLSLSNKPTSLTDKVTEQMQDLLDRRGHKIQSHVFGRLRNYYPPKIKFVPVPVNTAISVFLDV